MAEYTTDRLRTVALVGHGAAGKTTLVEQLLTKSKMIVAAGAVEKGTTVSDFDPLEKTTQHSLRSAIVHLDWRDARVHLIDTRGYPDFVGHAIGALDAVETVAVVINASAGIELTTRRMMEWARERNLCRMIVINKIDAENLNLPALLEQVQDVFGPECLPINLPSERGARVIDCFPDDHAQAHFMAVADVHRRVMEHVFEFDEEPMTRYPCPPPLDPSTLPPPL